MSKYNIEGRNVEGRSALFVGINNCSTDKLKNLKKLPADDAKDLQELITVFEEENNNENTSKFISAPIGHSNDLSTEELENKLIELFNPKNAENIPETALFFFSGHGFRKENGELSESYLCTRDTDLKGNWGVSLNWLRRLLEKSPIPEQIVWLDCCYSGGFILEAKFIFANAESGITSEEDYSRCFITASREYEKSWGAKKEGNSVFTKMLLESIEELQKNSKNNSVNSYQLIKNIKDNPKKYQLPLFLNIGNPITILGDSEEFITQDEDKKCPYKGLEYFDYSEDKDDHKYFFGREYSTQKLINQVRESNFVALLGASGSGKSSLLRAGLLYELDQGIRLSGSENWEHIIFKPGEKPLQALQNCLQISNKKNKVLAESNKNNDNSNETATEILAEPNKNNNNSNKTSAEVLAEPSKNNDNSNETSAESSKSNDNSNETSAESSKSNDSSNGTSAEVLAEPSKSNESSNETSAKILADWAANKKTRQLIVIDQFEEVFTLCEDKEERENFFECLTDVFSHHIDNLCIIISMRSDLLESCSGHYELYELIEKNKVSLQSLSDNELEDVIKKPAEKVGVGVDQKLVQKIINDFSDIPNKLPLLQFTLKALYDKSKDRDQDNIKLSLKDYNANNEEGSKGIGTFLDKLASDKCNELNEEQQGAAKKILLGLVSFSDDIGYTKKEEKQDKLLSSEVEKEVAEKFTKAGLLVKREIRKINPNNDEIESYPVIELAHESIIIHWSWLKELIEEHKENLKEKQKIEEKAKEWDLKERGNDSLLRGRLLKSANTYLIKNNIPELLLPQRAQEYILASKLHQRNEIIIKYSIIMVILLITSFFAVKFSDISKEAENIKNAAGSYLSNPKSIVTLLKKLSPSVRERQTINVINNSNFFDENHKAFWINYIKQQKTKESSDYITGFANLIFITIDINYKSNFFNAYYKKVIQDNKALTKREESYSKNYTLLKTGENLLLPPIKRLEEIFRIMKEMTEEAEMYYKSTNTSSLTIEEILSTPSIKKVLNQ